MKGNIIMIQKIIDRMIEKQVQNRTITFEEINIYKYGYILMFEVVVNVLLALIIGMIFNSLGVVLCFLGMYIPLRSFCGGWHADTLWKCTFISNFILLIEILCIRSVAQYINIFVLLFMFLVSVMIIIYMAPVETSAKKISKEEGIRYKKKIRIIILAQIIIMTLLVMLEFKNYVFVVTYVYIVQAILLLLEKLSCKIHRIKVAKK